MVQQGIQPEMMMSGLMLFIIVVLLYVLFQKQPEIEKEFPIPSSYIRVQFTEPNSKLPVGGNLGKQVLMVEDGDKIEYPYHPIFVNILASMKNLPQIDETLGQDQLPSPVLGEIGTGVEVETNAD